MSISYESYGPSLRGKKSTRKVDVFFTAENSEKGTLKEKSVRLPMEKAFEANLTNLILRVERSGDTLWISCANSGTEEEDYISVSINMDDIKKGDFTSDYEW